jgi:predicted outer membrane protein
MKTTLYLLATVLLLTSCGGNDSDNKANEVNEKRIDQQATGISDEAKKDAKKASAGFVELVSMAMTNYELSQLAAKQATNPEVKTFARQYMEKYVKDEKEMRRITQDLKLVVPTELSKEGRNRVDDLREEKPGTAFDLKYLEEVGNVNDKTADVADDLADDAPNDEVRTYANRIEKEGKELRDRAKSIRNVLN